MDIEIVLQYLREAPDNFTKRDSRALLKFLAIIKDKAVKSNKQRIAKEIWCFEQMIQIQDDFIESYFQMKSGEFYKAWCTLEQIEIALNSLIPHINNISDQFYMAFIEKHTAQLQSLFPYKLFLSPEFIELEKKCNICNKTIAIRNPCSHRVGEIYNGELCVRIVTNLELLGIGMVFKPTQKFAVPFILDSETNEPEDHYDYSIVNALIKRLYSPFHAWYVNWTMRRHPHSKFSHIGGDSLCPCESGKKYKDCCLDKSGVIRPHVEFMFEVPPPQHLLNVEYTY